MNSSRKQLRQLLVARADWKRPLKDGELDWNRERWAWEFLRRNIEYERDYRAWKELVVPRYPDMPDIWVAKPLTIKWGVQVPTDPAGREAAVFWLPDSSLERSLTPVDEYLPRWFLEIGWPTLEDIDPRLKEGPDGDAFESEDDWQDGHAAASQVFGDLQFDPVRGLSYPRSPNTSKLNPYEVSIRFNLNAPLRGQLQLAKRRLEDIQAAARLTEAANFGFRSARKESSEQLARDIRVFDAWASGAGHTEIAGGLDSSVRPPHLDPDLVKKTESKLHLITPRGYVGLITGWRRTSPES